MPYLQIVYLGEGKVITAVWPLTQKAIPVGTQAA
jgi:hypothetical protein